MSGNLQSPSVTHSVAYNHISVSTITNMLSAPRLPRCGSSLKGELALHTSQACSVPNRMLPSSETQNRRFFITS
jgi:hypothetical protein